MISVFFKVGNNCRVVSTVRPPRIYLDTCAFVDLAEKEVYGAPFVKSFTEKGTLMFSMANLLEISEFKGRSLKTARSFLDEIAENWVTLDVNPRRVMEKERQRQRESAPCFNEDFLRGLYPHIHGGPLSLGKIMELIQEEGVANTIRESCDQLKIDIKDDVCSERGRWNKNPKIIEKEYPIYSFDSAYPAHHVYNRLMRLIFKENFKFTEKDAVDLLHTTVPLAYSDLLILDRHWADLAQQKLGDFPNKPRVYRVSRIEAFLEDFENFPTN